MELILKKYKRLKSQLSGELGNEEDPIEASWNDGIIESMEELIKNLPKCVKTSIRLNHI